MASSGGSSRQRRSLPHPRRKQGIFNILCFSIVPAQMPNITKKKQHVCSYSSSEHWHHHCPLISQSAACLEGTAPGRKKNKKQKNSRRNGTMGDVEAGRGGSFHPRHHRSHTPIKQGKKNKQKKKVKLMVQFTFLSS